MGASLLDHPGSNVGKPFGIVCDGQRVLVEKDAKIQRWQPGAESLSQVGCGPSALINAADQLALWQCDFATKKMWTIRGCVDLYFLVVIHLGTRRCWISPSTVSPESARVCQQARNFLMHAEDVELVPTYVMRDNDVKYTIQFDQVFEANMRRSNEIRLRHQTSGHILNGSFRRCKWIVLTNS